MTRLYDRLVRTADGDAEGTTDGDLVQDREVVAANGLRQIAANALQGTGDQVVNAKTVLPWLLTGLGAPGILLGLLVPVREAGSMLPQAAMTSWVRRRRVRTGIWVAGALGQAVSVAAMALLAWSTSGVVAGVGIVAALAVFATSRALNSLSGKDVLGRTIPKGERGQVNGLQTVVAGAAAITLGVAVQVFGGSEVDVGVLAALLLGAAVLWVGAAAVFAGVREPVPDEEGDAPAPADGWVASSWSLLRSDAVFRRFVVVRTLLLVSALSPPFVVAVAASEGGAGLSGLGPFVIAQGIAGLVGGRWFGRLADRSSRLLMVGGAAVASVVLLAYVALVRLPASEDWTLLHPATYLLLALVHTGIRVARKTYVVDIAEGDRRTEYVAVSNTAMGVLLLVAGAVSGALATFGPSAALVFLALLGLAGVVVGRTLPEAEDEPDARVG